MIKVHGRLTCAGCTKNGIPRAYWIHQFHSKFASPMKRIILQVADWTSDISWLVGFRIHTVVANFNFFGGLCTWGV